MLRPRSILQLVLVGFGIATIPLLIAFVGTALFVTDLGRAGQEAILRAADVVQESRLLVEQADAMERNARQYLVLDDPKVLEVYRQRRAAFLQAAGSLLKLALTDDQRRFIEQLESLDARVYVYLTEPAERSSAEPFDPGVFAEISGLARAVLAASGQLISTNIRTLNDSAERVQQRLLWASLTLVPIALGLAGVFVVLIIRPLRALSQSIDRLGTGRFDEAVTIQGPRDLQKLGERLEWMRARLLDLENQKVLFLRNISHELKTPLTTLREGAQLLAEQVVGTLNKEQHAIVELLNQNSLQLQRMIEDLLQFSVSQQPPEHDQGGPVPLDRVIRLVLDEQRLQAQAKGIVMDVHLAPLGALGDITKLKAVFGNLVSNAIRFSPPNSPVRISLKKDGQWALFEIQDCGPGISESDRERVFEAFYRAQPADGACIEGSGLGLFIAREFVRLHKGTIDVMECTQGARLRVRLPLSTGEALTLDSTVAGAGDGGCTDAGGRLHGVDAERRATAAGPAHRGR